MRQISFSQFPTLLGETHALRKISLQPYEWGELPRRFPFDFTFRQYDETASLRLWKNDREGGSLKFSAFTILITMPSNRKYRLNSEAIAAIREIQKMVRAKFSSDRYFDDVLAFDPESDAPQPSAEAKIRTRMGDVADAVGFAPDLAYAIRKTGLMVTDRGKHLLDDAQLTAWNEAIDEYNRLARRPQ